MISAGSFWGNTSVSSRKVSLPHQIIWIYENVGDSVTTTTRLKD